MDSQLFNRLRRLGHLPVPRQLLLLLLALVIISPIVLYRTRMASYAMVWDDFPVVRDAVSWQRTQDTLWDPLSLHVCPPFRLLTWFLVHRAGELSAIPETLRIGSIVGFVLLLIVLQQLVSRETDSDLLGLAAVLLFGMTTSYYPALAVYTCSQAVWALALTLLTLVCVQQSRSHPRWWHHAGSFLTAALAPAWFSSALIAGPLGSLYGWLSADRALALNKRVWTALSPLLGTAVFACVAVLLAGDKLAEPIRFGGRPIQVAFRPDIGTYLTARAMTEHLLLWNLGIGGAIGTDQFFVWFGGLAVLCTWWYRRSSYRSLALTGVLLAVAGYLMVYTFRGLAGLDWVRGARWYLVFPHMGWTIFLTAGLDPRRQLRARPVTTSGVVVLTSLALVLFLLHGTIAVYQAQAMRHFRQLSQLRNLEMIDSLCDEQNISGQTMRQAIGPFHVDGAAGFDGLDLLELPDSGAGWDPAEVRRRLRQALEIDDLRAFGIDPPE